MRASQVLALRHLSRRSLSRHISAKWRVAERWHELLAVMSASVCCKNRGMTRNTKSAASAVA